MATKKDASNGHKRPKKEERPIPTDDVGLVNIYCTKCIIEAAKGGIHIRDHAKVTVSFTDMGLQVWCLRHDVNVIHLDFEGHKHPANMQT
jgi:hypothetical protein